MDKEAALKNDFVKTRDFFSQRVEYDSAHCLFIKWADNDFHAQRFTKEFTRIRHLFENDLHIDSTSFDLPNDSQKAQHALNRELVTFVERYSAFTRSLIIVYYAGHGDRDSDGRAQWMAKEEGGPTVNWANASNLLLPATGDVLILLDCCHGSLYEGAEKSRGKFEILAATTKGQLAIVPGRLSFTSHLIEEIRKRIHNQEDIIVRDIHKSLMRIAPSSDFPNPHYTDLTKGGAESINLRNLRHAAHSGYRKRSTGSIIFEASLSGDLDSHELCRWLQTYCPVNITSVHIERLILRARTLQHLQGAIDGITVDSPKLKQLGEQAEPEISTKVHDLKVALSQSKDSARNEETKTDATVAQKAWRSIEKVVAGVSRAIETALLSDDATFFDAGTDELLDIIESGSSPMIRRCLISTSIPREELRIDRDLVELPGGPQRFRCGRIEGRPVLVETFAYEPHPGTMEPYVQTILQVQKMANLICLPKEPFYHILPGRGYIQETLDDRIGLVFEIPEVTDQVKGPLLLSDLYSHSEFKRVALGKRIQLAQEVVNAVEHLHRLQWLHKELRSNNIIFLRNTNGNDEINFGEPWLCGFEYARSFEDGTRLDEDHEVDNNLYRHPDRWGKPIKTYARAHDIYSLGVILLEIFSWQSAKDIHKKSSSKDGRSTRIHSEGIKGTYLKKVRQDLPHLAGSKIATIVEDCLNFDTMTAGLSEYEIQLFFQKQILDRIASVVGLL